MKIALALPMVAAIVLVACQSSEPHATPAQPPVSADSMQTPRSAGSLQLTLETDKSTYRPGEPVALTLTVASSRDTTLEFSSGQRYDFQIVDASGNTAWTWSADRSFIQALGSERLAAGGSKEYSERFSGRLAPGTYQVTGSVTVMGSPLTTSTAITVQ